MALRFNCKGLAAMGVALLAIACGDDGGDKPDPTPTNDSGVQSPMDGGTTPATPMGNALGAQVAGKECTANAECGTGTARCATRLTLGSAGALVESVVGQEIFLDNPGGYCTNNCMNDSACGEGGVCFGAIPGFAAGECRKRCTADGDCREGYECAKQGMGGGDAGVMIPMLLPPTCQPRLKAPQLGGDVVGKACTEENAATVCGGGTCVANVCGGICAVDAECGAGARCQQTNIYGTLGICLETCSVDTDCNRFSGPSGGIGCTNGLCGAKVFPLMPGVVGNACTDRAQCGGSADCATMLGLPQRPAPGGYCSLLGCMESSQCGGGACIGSAITGSRCYKTCAADGDCRTGYTCQERMGYDMMPARVCAPAATTGDAGTPSASDAAAPAGDAG